MTPCSPAKKRTPHVPLFLHPHREPNHSNNKPSDFSKGNFPFFVLPSEMDRNRLEIENLNFSKNLSVVSSTISLFKDKISSYLLLQRDGSERDDDLQENLEMLFEKLTSIQGLLRKCETRLKKKLPKKGKSKGVKKPTATPTIAIPDKEITFEKAADVDVDISDELMVVKTELEEEAEAVYPDPEIQPELHNNGVYSDEGGGDPLFGVESGSVYWQAPITTEAVTLPPSFDVDVDVLLPSVKQEFMDEEEEDHEEGSTGQPPQNMEVARAYQRRSLQNCPPDLKEFAERFKKQRIALGFTQGQVGVAMEKVYGADYSQTTISRFEALKLSISSMRKLQPNLQKWMESEKKKGTTTAGTADCSGEEEQMEDSKLLGRKRKRRSTFDSASKEALERAFEKNPTPTSADLLNIAKSLGTEMETVRVWFCNRRQIKRREDMEDGEEDS